MESSIFTPFYYNIKARHSYTTELPCPFALTCFFIVVSAAGELHYLGMPMLNEAGAVQDVGCKVYWLMECDLMES